VSDALTIKAHVHSDPPSRRVCANHPNRPLTPPHNHRTTWEIMPATEGSNSHDLHRDYDYDYPVASLAREAPNPDNVELFLHDFDDCYCLNEPYQLDNVLRAVRKHFPGCRKIGFIGAGHQLYGAAQDRGVEVISWDNPNSGARLAYVVLDVPAPTPRKGQKP